MKLEFIDSLLTEVASAPARTPHPEDAIFDGSSAAKGMLEALDYVIKNPGSLTIKWDGYPALIFGRTDTGQLTVMDKYMFDKPTGQVTSPQDWIKYDQARGKNRGDLYQHIANIWSGLDQAVGDVPGYFWGDLLWSDTLRPVRGNFVFRPNVVEYHIPVNSNMGRQIAGKIGGIVVHTYLASKTAPPQPWNGQGLRTDAPVAILNPSANIKFKLDDPVRLHKTAVATLQKLGPAADKFMSGLDDKGRQALKQYANKLVTGQTREPVHAWLVGANFSQKLKKFLLGDNQGGYLYRNEKGLRAVFDIWNAVYAYKSALTTQLEQQVKDLGQFINGQSAGEGFVFSTPQGPIKLVQRGVFGQALFSR